MAKRNFKIMKFTPNIGEHDLQTKIRQIRKFLEKKLKVQIYVEMRGRENLHKELAIAVLDRLVKDTGDLGKMDPNRRLNGNSFQATISPYAQV